MYHSITLGDKNTWDDWHLIPTSRPVVNPPSVKTNLVEIPGGDGVIDLSTALTGRVLYGNRTGSWEFYAENGFLDWATYYSGIMQYLHGKKLNIVLEDDPQYYYEGRLSVNAWKSDKDRSSIVIDYSLHPYKKERNGSNNEWLWDTFNFETDVIRYYKDLPVRGSLDVVVVGTAMPSVPTLIVSGNDFSVRFGDTVYPLQRGNNVIDDIVLYSGENTLSFSGNGSLTIEHNGGVL